MMEQDDEKATFVLQVSGRGKDVMEVLNELWNFERKVEVNRDERLKTQEVQRVHSNLQVKKLTVC
jgi:hypothetical protein